jgi:ABC-type Fe3+/spermidine/putrescine transport system ATPase subunit
MREEIRKVQQRSGITAIYVTHDQEEALSISDHVAVMFNGVIEQVGTPVEVYDAPATANVANFIGKANLFPAMLTGHDGRQAVVETPAGETIRGTVRNEDLQPNSLVTVMIRPERIRMAVSQPALAGIDEAAADETNQVTATVEKFTYLGSRTRYVLQTRFGAELTVDSARLIEGAGPGSEVALSFDAREVLFLPFTGETAPPKK